VSTSLTINASTNYWATEATAVKVTDDTLTQYIDPRADGQTEMVERINGSLMTYTPKAETYNPDDRQWQGLPSLAKVGDRLWSVWYTGGTGEPRQFNYLVIAYSDDSGETWVDPFIIVDHSDPNNDGVCLGVPNFYVDESGQLCLIWIQYYTWIMRFDNAGAENIDDVTWQNPEVLTTSKIHKPPTYFTDSDGEEAMILASEAEAGDTHITTTRFYVSKNYGDTWELRSNLVSSVPNNRWFPESQIVQTSDNNLMVLSRIESGTAGGIELATSDDFGSTWSSYENNLDEPYLGPGSKFHVMNLESGNLLVINHNTTSSRSELVAYLSMDNGDTFPYSIVIDGRTDVSYPCAYEDNGNIYITWDKGRYLQKEIRFAVINEEDIIQGKYQSTDAVELGIISKLSADYTELISVNGAYSNELSFTVGTESASIRADLPTTLTVTDNVGNDYILEGVWKNPGYYEDILGEYRFYFQTNLPLNVEDTYNLLSVTVTLEESEGFNPNLLLYIGAPVLLIATTTVLILTKKKK
jgi:hypothetical protein